MDVTTIYQDEEQVRQLVSSLELASKGKKRGSAINVKQSTFPVKESPRGLQVTSWRFQDWDYKKRDLPTYARGLFTTKTNNTTEIAVRGYDKFFNTGEVQETKWENIIKNTKPPYELTLKENGCIIFISGLSDDTLIVCSKHSTGDRPGQVSHAKAGELMIEKQLAEIGKTKSDLARELRHRNVTAVAELCDDSFEEHILAYAPGEAGLYLHGMNFNVPEFATYPSSVVQDFAKTWGFRKTSYIIMDDIEKVKQFLDDAAITGAYDGRDVEGFVIRCKMSPNPQSLPFNDWFFKYKFEEPYLMYRQWRECTKALISGKLPRYNKHIKITEEYLRYTKRRLATEPNLGKLYAQNHGIISLRNDFLQFKDLNGAEAATIEDLDPVVMQEVTNNVILCPISTIGCGKTTLAVALQHIFGWGHIQNDNISGRGRPPRFTKAVMDQLKRLPVVFADRNNAQKHERRQIIMDTNKADPTVKLVCLHFNHDTDDVEEIRELTQQRVVARGDNHQTIHAASDKAKFLEVMDGFIKRFEPCDSLTKPDADFDAIINLDPTAGSRANLEIIITQLRVYFPNLIKDIPEAQQLDAAIEFALGYQPNFKHEIREKTKPRESTAAKTNSMDGPTKKKQKLEYMSVTLPSSVVTATLEQTFSTCDKDISRMYMQLKQTRRIQQSFHVTLIHRASEKEYPELWSRYKSLHDAAGGGDQELGLCNILLERVVFNDRLMAIVVRIDDISGTWICVNRVAHITIGTRDNSIKPKESNDLLAVWLDEGASDANDIQEVVFDTKIPITGVVKGILSR